jgi:hypothetical protein
VRFCALDVARIDAGAGRPRDCFRLLDSLDRQIFVRPILVSTGGVPRGTVCEPREAWGSQFRRAAVTLSGHFDESKRREFADRRSDGVRMQTVALEVRVSDGEAAIVVAPVVRVFNLNPIKRRSLFVTSANDVS